MILEPGRKCQFSVFGLFVLLCVGFQSFLELDDVSSVSRVRSRGSCSGPGGWGSPAAAPDARTRWGEHDAQRTGTWAEGPHPGKDKPPLETQGMHAGLGREAPPRLFTSVSFQTKLSWQLRATGVDLPTKSGGTSQGLWARGQRLQGRFAVAQVRGSAGTGRSQPGGADKGGRNRGDLVQGSRHQVSGSRMRATTVSCNPRGERRQAGRHHLNLGSRPCRG